MQLGWVDIPDSEYHRSQDLFYCVHSSGLKEMERSMAHWYASRLFANDHTTPALHFGSAFHAFILDTHKVSPVTKKMSFPKMLAEEQALYGFDSNLLVSEQDYIHLSAMRQMVMENEMASALLNHDGAIYEQAGFFVDPDYHLIGAIKPDIRIPSKGIIIDFKTAADASFAGFRRSIRRFKYDWQAWWYLRGANQISNEYYDTFLIIAIEKESPYGLNIFQIEDGLYYADIQIRPLLEKFEICLEADYWPNYKADEIIKI